MPLYVDGRKRGGGPQIVEVVDVSEKIAAAVRENGGRLGDLSKYTASEMKIVMETISEMADDAVARISASAWMHGVDIDKVVDTCETFCESNYEMDC